MWQYAPDGSLVSEHFEPQQACFAMDLQMKGSRQVPSVLFKMKEHLQLYLHAAADTMSDEDAPRTVADLAPGQQSHTHNC